MYKMNGHEQRTLLNSQVLFYYTLMFFPTRFILGVKQMLIFQLEVLIKGRIL